MALTIDEIYELHIKPLPEADRRKLVERVNEDLEGGREREPRPTRSIMELHGLGAHLWEGIDAQEYVNRERDEWDR